MRADGKVQNTMSLKYIYIYIYYALPVLLVFGFSWAHRFLRFNGAVNMAYNGEMYFGRAYQLCQVRCR